MNKDDSTSSSQTNLSMNPSNGTSQSNLLLSGSAAQNGSNSDLSTIKSMTSSYTTIRADSTDNGNNVFSGASMTQSMISPSESDQPRFKTPLLQTILSKTRINNIYNKYATNDGNNANSQTNEPCVNKSSDGCGIEATRIVTPIVNNEEEAKKPCDDDDKETANNYEHELQLTEVNVEVENSSSTSSSPSSPGSMASSTSSRSSQQASPPAQSTPPNQPPAPSHTQISA